MTGNIRKIGKIYKHFLTSIHVNFYYLLFKNQVFFLLYFLIINITSSQRFISTRGCL